MERIQYNGFQARLWHDGERWVGEADTNNGPLRFSGQDYNKAWDGFKMAVEEYETWLGDMAEAMASRYM